MGNSYPLEITCVFLGIRKCDEVKGQTEKKNMTTLKGYRVIVALEIYQVPFWVC